MTTTQIRDVLTRTNGTFMVVIFRKRSDQTLRTMRCRTGVRAHLKNPDAPIDPRLLEQDVKNDLLRVWDIEKRDYRSIPLDAVQEIRARGETVFTMEDREHRIVGPIVIGARVNR